MAVGFLDNLCNITLYVSDVTEDAKSQRKKIVFSSLHRRQSIQIGY